MGRWSFRVDCKKVIFLPGGLFLLFKETQNHHQEEAAKARSDEYSPLGVGEPVKKAGAEIQASGNLFNYLYLNCFFFLC